MKKILFVTPVPPYPADYGGAQRSFLLYQSLKRLGQVDMVLYSAQPLSEETLTVLREQFNLKAVIQPHEGTFTLRRLNFGYGRIAVNVVRLTRGLLRSRITLFKSRRAARALQQAVAGQSYDVVVGRYLWPLVQTDALGRWPTYVDFDDLESEIWQSRAEEAGGGALRAYYEHIAKDYERRQRALAQRLVGGWVAKKRDAERLGRDELQVLPNIPFSSFPKPLPPLPHTGGSTLQVLGVAIFDYRPNLLGFDWLVTKVWPKVKAAHPAATLNLVGRLTDEEVAQRWRAVPGVVLHGRVPELPPYYSDALFSVAPIFQGGGTNIKVIEALSLGRCCVCTPHAAKGFEGMDGLLVGADEDAYAAHCIRLLGAPDQTLADGQAGARMAAEQYAFDRFATVVQASMTNAPLPTKIPARAA